MRKEKKKEWISPRLKGMIEDNLDKGEQTLLFLNRRGFSPFVLCHDCGQDFKCPNCSVSLTLHQRKGKLTCHYCDFNITSKPLCPKCEGDNVLGIGSGTEKIEEDIQELFPDARIARMDRDTVKGKGEMTRLVNAFEKREFDILIGTQMVAKGHHFPGVSLVGVLLADLSLNIPDFRAAERTFQLLTQVAGRAGRGDIKGKVVIQTFNPDHYSILHGGEKDGEQFYSHEMALREDLSYPPFARIVNFRISGNSETRVAKGAASLKKTASSILREMKINGVELLGPAPAPLSRLKGKSRWQMLARCREVAPLHRFTRQLLKRIDLNKREYEGVRVTPDIDPYNMM